MNNDQLNEDIQDSKEQPGDEPVIKGLLVYPPSEDIYVKGEKGQQTLEEPSNSDLDVPGAEQDDADESIGSEDEENNYYSIGGDEHNDLDEQYRDDLPVVE